jgi:alpha-1,2-mannosyltransferase
MSQRRLSTLERALGLALISGVLLSGFYFATRSGNNPEAYSNDFNVYYHAAREIIAGRDPYAHSLGDWTPYIYPPLLAELVVPLALLPLPVAAHLWYLINALSTVLAAWLAVTVLSDNGSGAAQLFRYREATLWRVAIATGAVLLVLRFVFDTFSLGQVNALLAALAVAHIYFYSRGRTALSAVLLAVAVSIKLTPALLLLYHLTKMRLKFAMACAGILIALTGVSLMPFGLRGTVVFQTFLQRTVENEQGYDFSYSGNQTVRGATARSKLLNEDQVNSEDARKPIDWATAVSSIALLSLAAFAAAKAKNELAAAAPFFCGFVLLSPLSWKAHYVVLIPAAARLLFAAIASEGRALAIMSSIGAFVLFNFTSPKIIGLKAAEWADEHSLVLVGALFLFIACVALNFFVNGKNRVT